MTGDWRDTLGSLLPDLPEGSESSETSEISENSERSERQTLRVSVERKGRGGKVATIIYGFGEDFPQADIDELGSALRRRLGTGGSARGGEILIQGDRGRAVVDALKALGHTAKLC